MKFGGNKGYTKGEPGTGDGERWIKNFRDGESDVRFLEQQDDWTPYWEHYDGNLGTQGKYFPCTGERDTCPGCTSENERTAKASKRFLANALVKWNGNGKDKGDDKGPYVDIYKVPQTVADEVNIKSARDEGNLFQRAYIITRQGKGTDTKYYVDREEKDPTDVSQYLEKFQDHEEALQNLWTRAFPGDAAPKEEKAAPRRQIVTSMDVEKTQAEEAAAASKPKDLGEPPSEPQRVADQAAEADEEVTISEDELRKMPPEDIKGLIKQCGLEVPDTDDQEALADYLIAQLA